jgi:hypothetical protein
MRAAAWTRPACRRHKLPDAGHRLVEALGHPRHRRGGVEGLIRSYLGWGRHHVLAKRYSARCDETRALIRRNQRRRQMRIEAASVCDRTTWACRVGDLASYQP